MQPIHRFDGHAGADGDATGKEMECTAYYSGFRDTPDIQYRRDGPEWPQAATKTQFIRTTHSQGY
ncbi:hypothetical protein GCM10010971_41010 [Silvimonas amylolytica]|uniref:Uncharacterized protein n=1 Tax=Silvimonas amylolytica TaxID=449663 RepID=A0ABQ2PTH9_9NEIS|nr:hypothetical protein GCM10010971_41010 [Silvimonas amylolytica]